MLGGCLNETAISLIFLSLPLHALKKTVQSVMGLPPPYLQTARAQPGYPMKSASVTLDQFLPVSTFTIDLPCLSE